MSSGGNSSNLERNLLSTNKKLEETSLWVISINISAFSSCYFGSYFSDQKFFNDVNHFTKHFTKQVVDYITGLF